MTEINENALGWSRKYRPKVLDDILGNTLVKQRLSDMFSTNQVPQTLLFEGPRGCGKSSLSRIVTKTLLCVQPNDDGTSCENCESCISMNARFIGKGESVNSFQVQLIDIGNFNSKDSASKLVEQMKSSPMNGKKKIYILDEIQRASEEAQNAYLKICEEPGTHLWIIMCTTEIDKLIEPLKSRFTRMTLRRPSSDEMIERLRSICEVESVKYTFQTLQLITLHHGRVPRECINELEAQSVTKSLNYDNVAESLRIVGKQFYHTYFTTLMEKDLYEALSYVDLIYSKHDIDYEIFLEGLSGYVVDLLYLKMGIHLEQYSKTEFTNLRRMVKTIAIDELGSIIREVEQAINSKGTAKFRLDTLTIRLINPEYLSPQIATNVERDAKKEYDDGVKKYSDIKTTERLEEEKNYKETILSTEDVVGVFENAEVAELDSATLAFFNNMLSNTDVDGEQNSAEEVQGEGEHNE